MEQWSANDQYELSGETGFNDLKFYHSQILSHQTNGQIMDIYRGWFSQNGGSGYVLKPRFLRDKYSTFNVRRKDVMPGKFTNFSF